MVKSEFGLSWLDQPSNQYLAIQLSTDEIDKFQQAVDVTAADLFIVSEVYQNLEKEIESNMRRERNAISKLVLKEDWNNITSSKRYVNKVETHRSN